MTVGSLPLLEERANKRVLIFHVRTDILGHLKKKIMPGEYKITQMLNFVIQIFIKIKVRKNKFLNKNLNFLARKIEFSNQDYRLFKNKYSGILILKKFLKFVLTRFSNSI